MDEKQTNIPEEGKKVEACKRRVSPKIKRILDAVRAGTMAVSIAAQSLLNISCGGIMTRDETVQDDTGVQGGQAGATSDTGTGGEEVDAGDTCYGIDAGQASYGVDAGDACYGVDAGDTCYGSEE